MKKEAPATSDEMTGEHLAIFSKMLEDLGRLTPAARARMLAAAAIALSVDGAVEAKLRHSLGRFL